MNDVMKIVKSLEEFGLLIKGVFEKIKIEAKVRFLSMLLGATLLGNLLTVKGPIRVDEGTIQLVKIFNAASSFKQF